jgi:benzoate/toluate 1,2-dioxygenase subunit beta
VSASILRPPERMCPGIGPDLQRSVEQFLFHEAHCMDEHRYDDWLALWSDGPLQYWVPCSDEDTDPMETVSIIHDDREQLTLRLNRLKGRQAYSQQPRSRLTRLLANVTILADGPDELVAASTFTLGDWRGGEQNVWFGRNLHVLRRQGGQFRMRQKKVLLLNNDGALGNLTFLI